jgi:hypothetical protein
VTPDDPPTEELEALQADKAEAERKRAAAAETSTEERAHQRRAEKAEYLRDKLDDQGKALGS